MDNVTTWPEGTLQVDHRLPSTYSASSCDYRLSVVTPATRRASPLVQSASPSVQMVRTPEFRDFGGAWRTPRESSPMSLSLGPSPSGSIVLTSQDLDFFGPLKRQMKKPKTEEGKERNRLAQQRFRARQKEQISHYKAQAESIEKYAGDLEVQYHGLLGQVQNLLRLCSQNGPFVSEGALDAQIPLAREAVQQALLGRLKQLLRVGRPTVDPATAGDVTTQIAKTVQDLVSDLRTFPPPKLASLPFVLSGRDPLRRQLFALSDQARGTISGINLKHEQKVQISMAWFSFCSDLLQLHKVKEQLMERMSKTVSSDARKAVVQLDLVIQEQDAFYERLVTDLFDTLTDAQAAYLIVFGRSSSGDLDVLGIASHIAQEGKRESSKLRFAGSTVLEGLSLPCPTSG